MTKAKNVLMFSLLAGIMSFPVACGEDVEEITKKNEERVKAINKDNALSEADKILKELDSL